MESVIIAASVTTIGDDAFDTSTRIIHVHRGLELLNMKMNEDEWNEAYKNEVYDDNDVYYSQTFFLFRDIFKNMKFGKYDFVDAMTTEKVINAAILVAY